MKMCKCRCIVISLLALVLCSLSWPHVVLACPAEVCACKWKGGKQTVECGGQQLPNIPEGMDPGTQVLNFSGNSLQVLQSERFLRMDLLNLQKIYLSRNQLIRIHEKAFRGLSNLVELDLSDNALQNVPSETFQDYSSLMRLSLSGNPIRELKTSAFRHLSFLTTLELSNCQIERIENEAFVGMDNLEWLRLDGNRIGFIQGAHILPKSLHGISLQNNRWTCDCRLLDMHAWLVNHNTPQTEEPKCVDPPRVKGQNIKSLQKDELACLPEVRPESTYTEISEGRNVSIVCVVRAIPEPRVLWLFNGQVLNNDSYIDNLHMYYYIDETSGGSAEEKRSEIFIYNVGAEDNGTFSCVGQNVAGTRFSNYTLRVIIKEPPVVNEVSFPRDYMNYIVASSAGAGVIFVVLLATVVVKCKRQRQPSKRKKCGGAGGVGSGINSVTGGNTNTRLGAGTNEMKCSAIINGDGDSLNGSAGMHTLGDRMTPTPTKLGKENGIIMSGQLQQNLLLYATAQQQQQQQQQAVALGENNAMAAAAQALHMNAVNLNATGSATPPPPPPLLLSTALSGAGSLAYCSPPSSLRNYATEKNPDLVNDAESGVKHKLKSAGSLDAADYDAASDCSGPCSIQGGVSSTPLVQYDNCYQLAPQFSAQFMRAGVAAAPNARFSGMTTLPRGLQLKTVLNNGAVPQHQMDVHLNPVCFLGQDGYAYDYTSGHIAQLAATAASPGAHQHLHLQAQHSAPQQQPQPPQQNFYRTLPHNRAHKQQQFAATAANPTMRYSLEAELLQRSATPTTYDKYMPNVRFTAEGYPQQAGGQPLLQYPSPPEGYKSTPVDQTTTATGIAVGVPAFQQWPPCLPGYHAQAQAQAPPVRYLGMLSPQQQKQQQQLPKPTTPTLTSCSQTQTPNNNNNNGNMDASATPSCGDVKKRCVGAQADNSTIPECDEHDTSPTTTTSNTSSSSSSAASGSASSSVTVTAAAGTVASDATNAPLNAETTKLRHLNGPLADSPDEGYVGDSHEGSDI